MCPSPTPLRLQLASILVGVGVVSACVGEVIPSEDAVEDGAGGTPSGGDGEMGGDLPEGSGGRPEGSGGRPIGGTGGRATVNTGGVSMGGAGSGSSGGFPMGGATGNGFSHASIEAFLAAGTYKSAPWVGDGAIRNSSNAVNIHGNGLRVYFNPTAVRSKQSGGLDAETGTMVVIEFFDESSMSVGHAVQIKSGDGDTRYDWTYYCSAPEDSERCSGNAADMPLYGEGVSECGFCHGNMPYADLPN